MYSHYYEGQRIGNIKHGLGRYLKVLRNEELIIHEGFWIDDKLHGKCRKIEVSPHMSKMDTGTFKQGLLHGYAFK